MSKKKSKPVCISPIVLLIATVTALLALVFIIGCFLCLQKGPSLNESLSTNTGCAPWFDGQPNPLMQSPEIFFTVTGQVNGSPLLNATVYLYVVSDTRRSTVLAAIQNGTPAKKVSINETHGFAFSCISPGNYAAVMSGSFFDGPISGPVPNTWQAYGYALNVSFHGYHLKHRNLVVGFSIANICEHGS